MANNYKVKMVDLQNKYKFKIFCSSQMYDDTDLKREVEAIYKAFPKASATGTDATLTGTAAALMNLDLKGNGGKNLFDYTTTVFANPDRVSIETSNDTITITTLLETTSQDLFLRTKIPDELLINGQTYTISSENVSGVYKSLKLQLRNKNGTAAGLSNGTSITYDDTYSLFVVENPFATSGSTVIPAGTVCVIKNVQVEKGSTATDYEPYGASVTGDNTIDICGKNLFDDEWEDGQISSSTGQDQAGSNVRRTKNYIPIQPNTVYTLSRSSSDGTMPLRFYDKNKNYLGYAEGLISTRTIKVFTSLANAYYVRFVDWANGSTDTQLEIGNITSPVYEPYIGKSYPINLGTTKLKTDDSIQGTKNNWNIVRADGTIEPIADTTLISQLNNLRYNAESYEGQTNISQANSDMPFIFTASAIKDLSNL